MSITRKYNTEFRKKIGNKIKLLNSKEEYLRLFNIIKKDKNNKYSKNTNGIWLNLNNLSDKTIDKIKNFLSDTLDLTSSIENFKYEYKPYINDGEQKILGPKLSNHERSLIKRINFSTN